MATFLRFLDQCSDRNSLSDLHQFNWLRILQNSRWHTDRYLLVVYENRLLIANNRTANLNFILVPLQKVLLLTMQTLPKVLFNNIFIVHSMLHLVLVQVIHVLDLNKRRRRGQFGLLIRLDLESLLEIVESCVFKTRVAHEIV